MATAQGYIQPIAQDAQQFIPNNGNPNTVYNVAPPGAATQPQAPAGGWASAGVNPAANYSGGVNVGDIISQSNEQLKTQGWAAPAPDPNANKQKGIMQLPTGWAEEIKNFQPKTAEEVATTPTTTTTPSYDLNKQWIVMDGNIPRKNSNLYANDPAYRAAWDQLFAEHQSRMGKSIEDKRADADVMANVLRNYYQMYMDNNWRPDPTYTSSQGKNGNPMGTNSTIPLENWATIDPKGYARLIASGMASPNGATGVSGGGSGTSTGGTVKGIDLSTVANYVTTNNGSASNIGWNSDSSKTIGENLTNYISNAVNSVTSSNTGNKIMEVLDRITEPFLPGNLYMSELGKLNMPNVLASVMNQVIPGLGTLGKWIAGKIPQDATGLLGKIRDFFQKGKFQEAANEIYKNTDMEAAQNQAIYGSSGGAGAWAGGGIGGWAGLGGSIGGGGGGGKTGTVSLGSTSNPDKTNVKTSTK